MDAFSEIPSSEGYEQKAKETMSVAQTYEEKMRKFLKDRQVKGDVLSVCGHRPGETVVQAARQHGAELIVTGCRNQGGLRSVSQYITHNANCAVMVCREYVNGRNKTNKLVGHGSTALETV
ncbi:hypothetical protein LSAT2_017668 [Lamellibrachia satsuma]|nr:hypothetical protein LSAT2_017668 [Lamellibrachia satsuma]